MKEGWIANRYHKKHPRIILAQRELSSEEMDNIVENHIEAEKKKFEDHLRRTLGFLVHYPEKIQNEPEPA